MNRHRAGALLLGLACLGLGADTIYRARPRADGGSERTDLPVYLAAGARLLRGEEPLGATSGRGWSYWYPPTLAALLLPLGALPLPLAAGVWFAISTAALGAGVVGARRALGRAGAPGPWELLALCGAVLPASSALLRGQVGPLLLGLIGLGLAALRGGRDARAGALFGLATAIKLTPGVLLLGLLAGRRWRGAASGAAALLAGWLLLPAPFLGLTGAARSTAAFAEVMVLAPVREPEGIRAPGREGVQDPHLPTNQSLSSQVVRRTSPGPLRAALLGALALALLPGLLLCARGGATAPRPEAAGLLLAWTLVSAPIAWHHHHVLLVPVLLALAGPAAAGRRPAQAGLTLFLALSLLHFAVGPLRPLGLLGWGTALAAVALATQLAGDADYTVSDEAGEKKS